jgi:hypothetical protein
MCAALNAGIIPSRDRSGIVSNTPHEPEEGLEYLGISHPPPALEGLAGTSCRSLSLQSQEQHVCRRRCYAAKRSPLRGKTGEPVKASTGRIGRSSTHCCGPTFGGRRIKLDWTIRAASFRPHPNGTLRLTLEHDRVGTRLMAYCEYVPEQPATQCEGTCARDCNYLISAVVTKPGPTAEERYWRYVAPIEYKPQCCQRQ